MVNRIQWRPEMIIVIYFMCLVVLFLHQTDEIKSHPVALQSQI
jgi:hypothetical protein